MLKITEQSLIRNPAGAVAVLQSLKEIGVRIAIGRKSLVHNQEGGDQPVSGLASDPTADAG